MADCGVLSVREPGEDEIVATGLAVPDSPVVGRTYDITVTAENRGDAEGTRRINVIVGTATLDSLSFTLASGESTQKTTSWTPEDPGDTTIIAGQQNRSLTVREPGAGGAPPLGGLSPLQKTLLGVGGGAVVGGLAAVMEPESSRPPRRRRFQ